MLMAPRIWMLGTMCLVAVAGVPPAVRSSAEEPVPAAVKGLTAETPPAAKTEVDADKPAAEGGADANVDAGVNTDAPPKKKRARKAKPAKKEPAAKAEGGGFLDGLAGLAKDVSALSGALGGGAAEAGAAVVEEQLLGGLVLGRNAPEGMLNEPNKRALRRGGILVLDRELTRLCLTVETTSELRAKLKAVSLKILDEQIPVILKNTPHFQPEYLQDQQVGPLKKAWREAFEASLPTAAREAFRADNLATEEIYKEASLAAVVEIIAARLVFTADQETQLEANLRQQWQPEWRSWHQISQYSGQYVPSVPDDPVVPLLDDDQKLVWQSLQKIGVGDYISLDSFRLMLHELYPGEGFEAELAAAMNGANNVGQANGVVIPAVLGD